MKSFSTASLVAALALVPSAFAADKYFTTIQYSDSACTTLTGIVTFDVEALYDITDCTSYETSCTTNDDDDSAYAVGTCGSSMTGEMGDHAYYLAYSDSACTTAYGAGAVLGYDSCAATGTAASVKSDCDTSGYVTEYNCDADATCTTCTVDTMYPTTCTDGESDDSSSYMAFCGTPVPTSAPTSAPTTVPTSAPAGSSSSDDTCFSGDDSVTLASGAAKQLSAVEVGDQVLTADAHGALSFAPVVALPHAANNKLAAFVHVATASGKSVKATKMHLLQQCHGSLAYAGTLSAGDCLRTVDSDEAVAAVSMTQAAGIYTAVTTNEFLVVNGIVASPFAVSHGLASAYYSAHRAVADRKSVV